MNYKNMHQNTQMVLQQLLLIVRINLNALNKETIQELHDALRTAK